MARRYRVRVGSGIASEVSAREKIAVLVGQSLMVMGDGTEVRVGGGVRGAEIGARDAVMPGEFVFVPLDPQETEKERAGRKHVAGSAEQELARGRLFAGKIDDAKTAQHHAGSGAAENGEQREVLQINDGERNGVDGGVELAEGEVSAERAEKGEESAAGEEEAGGVDEAGETAFFDGRDRVLAGLLVCGGGLRLSGELLSGVGPRFAAHGTDGTDRERNVNEHLRFVGGRAIGGAADGDGEGKVVGRGGRRLGNSYVDAGDGNFSGAFERQLGLAIVVGRSFAAARAVRRDALRDFAAPSRIGVDVSRRGSAG